MNTLKITAVLPRILWLLLATCALRLSADVVLTTNGARIVGKISEIHDGTVTIQTDYAGELKIKQNLVTSIETDQPIAVRLKEGKPVVGVVSQATDGRMKIASADGDVYASMGNVMAAWGATDEDPAVVALRKKWSFELGVDINGATGTQNQLGTAGDFKGERKGPNDDLKVYTAYNRQVTNGQKSADQFNAGVDYSDNFTTATSWYVRDEIGYDHVMDITFDDVAAAGLGYDFIKTKDQTLTGRAGVSYREYDYSAAADTASLSALGADFELQYSLMVGKSQLTDKIAYLPDFADTGNFIVNHELAYIIPITKSLWKLSIGVSNNYNSQPVPGVEKLETLYFTRLEMTWGQK